MSAVLESEVSAAAPDASQGLGGFAVLRRRRIYILPTRQGIAFGGVLLVMLLGSVNYNNGLGYALSFLLASLGLVSLLHTYRNLAGLGLRLRAGPPAFAGGAATFELVVDNRGLPARPALVLRLRCLDTEPVGSETGSGRERRRAERRRARTRHERDTLREIDLPAGGLHRIALQAPARSRGWLEVERVVVATRYPFGIFRAWSTPELEASSLVYPRPGPARPLPPVGRHDRRDDGRAGRGNEDFSGLRDYRREDSPRRIHWKALARERGLLVKQFEGGAPADLVLRWCDTVGPTETRISELTRWVLDADAAGHRYALELDPQPAGLGEPGQGRAHREAALAALATYRLAPARVRHRVGSGGWTGGV